MCIQAFVNSRNIIFGKELIHTYICMRWCLTPIDNLFDPRSVHTLNMHIYTYVHTHTQTSLLSPSHIYTFDNSLTQDLSASGSNTLTAYGNPVLTSSGKVYICIHTHIFMCICACVGGHVDTLWQPLTG